MAANCKRLITTPDYDNNTPVQTTFNINNNYHRANAGIAYTDQEFMSSHFELAVFTILES